MNEILKNASKILLVSILLATSLYSQSVLPRAVSSDSTTFVGKAHTFLQTDDKLMNDQASRVRLESLVASLEKQMALLNQSLTHLDREQQDKIRSMLGTLDAIDLSALNYAQADALVARLAQWQKDLIKSGVDPQVLLRVIQINKNLSQLLLDSHVVQPKFIDRARRLVRQYKTLSATPQGVLCNVFGGLTVVGAALFITKRGTGEQKGTERKGSPKKGSPKGRTSQEKNIQSTVASPDYSPEDVRDELTPQVRQYYDRFVKRTGAWFTEMDRHVQQEVYNANSPEFQALRRRLFTDLEGITDNLAGVGIQDRHDDQGTSAQLPPPLTPPSPSTFQSYVAPSPSDLPLPHNNTAPGVKESQHNSQRLFAPLPPPLNGLPSTAQPPPPSPNVSDTVGLDRAQETNDRYEEPAEKEDFFGHVVASARRHQEQRKREQGTNTSKVTPRTAARQRYEAQEAEKKEGLQGALQRAFDMGGRFRQQTPASTASTPQNFSSPDSADEYYISVAVRRGQTRRKSFNDVEDENHTPKATPSTPIEQRRRFIGQKPVLLDASDDASRMITSQVMQQRAANTAYIAQGIGGRRRGMGNTPSTDGRARSKSLNESSSWE